MMVNETHCLNQVICVLLLDPMISTNMRQDLVLLADLQRVVLQFTDELETKMSPKEPTATDVVWAVGLALGNLQTKVGSRGLK